MDKDKTGILTKEEIKAAYIDVSWFIVLYIEVVINFLCTDFQAWTDFNCGNRGSERRNWYVSTL